MQTFIFPALPQKPAIHCDNSIVAHVCKVGNMVNSSLKSLQEAQQISAEEVVSLPCESGTFLTEIVSFACCSAFLPCCSRTLVKFLFCDLPVRMKLLVFQVREAMLWCMLRLSQEEM